MQTRNDPIQLYQNIKDARQQLAKYKQQASLLESQPFSMSTQNINDYIRNVAYSLSKNDKNIDKKISLYVKLCQTQKSKLPSIHRQQQQIDKTQLKPYKKYKKSYKQNYSNRSNDQQLSNLQNNINFSVQNRQIKIYSNYQRYFKPEYKQPIPQNKLRSTSQLQHLKDQPLKIQKTHPVKKQHIFISYHKKNHKQFSLNKNHLPNQTQSFYGPSHQPQYDAAIDKYSKHQFMIINGKIVCDTPEFASYHRIYQSIFHKIKQQISRLENLLTQKSVNYVRLNGKKLAYLCLKKQIKKTELIDCLVDEDNEIKRILLPSIRYIGKQGKLFAITKIQSYFRMHQARKNYLKLKAKTKIIQNFFKKKYRLLQLQKQIHQKNINIMLDFQNRQQTCESNWKQIKNKKRIEIHLNSIQIDQDKRLTIQNFGQRENIQLSRIFKLKDDNLILIYISPVELSIELINYYYKMLELAGIQKYEDRLLFFTPSTANIFPKHFSLSKLLYYSSKTLNQLKIITEDLPTLLVPGNPSNELIKICHFLKCYLFSGAPQKMKLFSSKSQTLNFLKNLSIPCLPSAMQMYDYGQFLNTFAVLIIKNSQIQTWVLKIDDEFGGRGIAYFNVGKSKLVQKLLQKINYGSSNNQFFTTGAVDATSELQNQQITIKIRDYLRQSLPQRLCLAAPTVYRSYSQFMGRFIKNGGIIQAKPTINNKNTLSYPSFSFVVDPLGEFQIFTSYDKIIGSPYRSYACSFPQKSMSAKEANRIIRQICQSFKIRKIFGYFTIDFIVSKEIDSVKQLKKTESTPSAPLQKAQLWVLGVQPCLNNYSSSFYPFDVLMKGRYFQQKSLYLIQNQDSKQQLTQPDTVASEIHSQSPNNLCQRTYIYIPHIFNQNMFMVKIKQFFKQAKIQKFYFDIGNKEGICVLLLDQLTCGTLSMIAVGRNQYYTINLIKNVLQFIARLSSVKNINYGTSQNQSSTDKILLKDMLNLFMSILRKDQRQNSKAKALKQFENNQKFELLY